MSKSIYVPGVGQITPAAMRVHKAVSEYDERLYFAKNPVNNDWCVYMKMPHGEEPRIIHGFGYDVPEPGRVIDAIVNKDTLRQGDAWYQKHIIDHNERLRREKAYAKDQQVWDAAERVEHSLRKTEGLTANPNIVSTRKVNKKK